MTRLPFELTRIAGVVWVLYAPLLLLGAALSRMDTPERYYLQFLVLLLFAIVGAIAGVRSFANKPWSRIVLIILSWASAAFWLSSAYALAEPGEHVAPVLIGLVFVTLAVLLHAVRPRADAV